MNEKEVVSSAYGKENDWRPLKPEFAFEKMPA